MNQAINTCITGLNNIGQGFWDYAVSIFVQSSVLIILLLIIDFVLRKRVRAVFRYCVWMLVFVKLILPTSFALPTGIGYWLADYWPTETSVSEQKPTPTVEQAVPAAVPEQRQVVTLEPAVINETVPVEVKLEPICWQGLVFLGWLAGVLVLSALLIQRVWFVKALVAQSKPAKGRLLDTLNECRSQIGIRKTIELRLSDNMASPAVCGLFKPVILMPTALLEKLSLEKLKAVLIHELAHIKRRDIWVNVVQTVLQIVYFYNPLLWLANAMVRRVREQAVDEMVLVALGAEADSYSNTLIDIGEMAFWRPNLSLRVIGVVESKSALAGRIKHILGRPMPKSAKIGIVGVLAVIIAGAVLLPMAKAKDSVRRIADSEQGATEKSEFKATLSNGVTVELVGLCEEPVGGAKWWKPDGRYMPEPFFKANKRTPPSKGMTTQYAFLAKAEGSEDISIKMKIYEGFGWSTQVAEDGTALCYIKHPNDAKPYHEDAFSQGPIEVGVAQGQWIKGRGVSSPNIQIPRSYSIGNHDEIVIQPPRPEKNSPEMATIFWFTSSSHDYEYRLICTLKDGSVEECMKPFFQSANIIETGNLKNSTLNTKSFNIDRPLEQIVNYELLYRKFDYARFNNVAFKPNAKTDVQVEVEVQSSRSNLIEKLQVAIVGGDISKVEKLIGEGVSVNMPGKEGKTPLRWAVDAGHKEIVELLIRNGANVNTPDDYGNTPLHLTGTKPKPDTAKYLDIAGILIANGADLNAKARSNRTPLHFCSKYGRKEIVELLLASGASIDPKDDFGKTPLLFAAGVHKEVSELLIENGADVAAKDKYGQTPLHLAANWGHVDIVKLFLDQGVDINAKDNSGLTPLDYATKKKYWDVMKLLKANSGYSAYKLENFELKRVFLPDVDDKAVMLDLASGQLVDIPKPVTGLEVLAAIDKLDKGDITYDARNLIFVRGATSNKSDVQVGPGSVKVYKIIDGWHLPERMIVTTQSGEQYELSIIGANKKGCRINYYHLVKADVEVEGEDNNSLYQKQGSIRYALEFIGTPEELIDTTFISKRGQLANPQQLEFANKLFSIRKSKDVDMFISLLSDGSKKQIKDDDNNRRVLHHRIKKIKEGTFLAGQYDFKFFATFREFTDKDWNKLKKHVSFPETPTHTIVYWHFHKPDYSICGSTYYLIEDNGSYKFVAQTLLSGPVIPVKEEQPTVPKEYGIVAFKQTDNAYTQPAVWKYEWNIELSSDVSENNVFQILKTTKVVSGQADLHPEIAAQKIIDESIIEKYKYDILKCRFYVGDLEPSYNYRKYGRQLSGWAYGFSIASWSRSTSMLFPGKDVTNVKPNKQGNFVGSDLELLSFETSEENIRYEHKVILRKDDSPEAKSAALLRLEQMTRRRISNKKLQYLDGILTTYANDHNSEYPDRLVQIKPYDTDEWLDWLLENIEYLGKGKTLTETSKTVIAYDKTLLEKAGSTNVLFNDGPVQYCNPNWLKKIGITVDHKPAVQVEVEKR